MEIPPLQKGCPWYELSSWALPNVKWCEAQQCSWIVEPANTWSNLAYISIGVALLALSAKSGNRLMRIFGVTQVAVGVTSFVYHASYTFVLQVLDFVGMYLFAVMLVVFNLRRLGIVHGGNQWRVYSGGVAACTALTLVFRALGLPIQSLVLLLILGMLGTEVIAWLRRSAPVRYAWFFTSLGLITVAATFSALDASRVFCDPENHFVQGHAIWHVLSALSLLASFKFYDQFAAQLLATGETAASPPGASAAA